MSTELLPNGTLKIEAYSFAEFLSEYQQAVLDGYSLDLETNEHFPQKYGDHLFVILKADQWETNPKESDSWSHIGESKVYTELEALEQATANYPEEVPVRTPRKPRVAKE